MHSRRRAGGRAAREPGLPKALEHPWIRLPGRRKLADVVSRNRRIDPRLADAIAALGLNALLPPKIRKARLRLRGEGADRHQVLGHALNAVLPPDTVIPLLNADGLVLGGDWLGVMLGVDFSFVALESLLQAEDLRDHPVGVGLVWRMAFFELAVRIAAASFARAPDDEPTLRYDLWAQENGFGLFVEEVLREHGLGDQKAEKVLIEYARAGLNVAKSQTDRWLYEDRDPQARNIESLSRAIAVASKNDRDEFIAALRLRFHLFVGCRGAYETISKLLGEERASTLAATFSKQVHCALHAFQDVARKLKSGPQGPLEPERWLAECRRFARDAAVSGVRGGLGAALLDETADPDLRHLVWPAAPLWVSGVQPPNAARESGHVHPASLADLVPLLSLDDVVADASQRSTGRQPLGWMGLFESVLGMRLSG